MILKAHKLIVLLIFIALNSFCLLNVNSQDTNFKAPKKIYNKQTFKSTRFINIPTIKGHPKGGFEFSITHRFGQIKYNEEILKNFLGLDLSTNIRFGFAMPVSERFYLGVGRTKYNKIYDLEANYIFMRQTMDWKQPVTIALYHNTSYMSDDFPKVQDNMFNSDTTPFKYKEGHRFSYYTQLSIACQLKRWLSVQISPAITYKNLVPVDIPENWMLAIPFSGRIKTSMRTSVIFEIAPVIANAPKDYTIPAGIGFEVKTISHAFQITINNTKRILNQEIYYSNVLDPFNDGIFLGFNLQKFFYVKK